MHKFGLVLLLAGELGVTEARPWASWEWAAPLGCGIQLNSLPWEHHSLIHGSYVDICTYEPALGSWATCINELLRENYDEREYLDALARTMKTVNMCCARAGGGVVQLSLGEFNSSLQNATNFIVDITNVNMTEGISFPVELESRSRRNIASAVRKNFANLQSSNSASVWLYYFSSIFIIFLVIAQLGPAKRALLRVKPINVARALLELPPLLKTHTVRSTLGGFVPTRFEVSCLSVYFVLHTYLLFAGYDIDENGTFASVRSQYLRALAVRSGILAFWQFPLLMALGTRSNILELLAGMKFSTVIVFHKWISRIMVFDAVIHSVAFEISVRLAGKHAKESQELFWRSGVQATYLCCAILILSLGFLRKNCYEVFLYLHITFAIIFFYLCWIHAKRFGWLGFIYSTCGIWALERLLRLWYISKFGLAYATIEQAGPDLFTVKIPKPKNRLWLSAPGQYVFIYFLSKSTFWQSHPFTFIDLGQELYVVIKAKEGATGSILRKLKDQGGYMVTPVFVEGPYGHVNSYSEYDATLFLCGGSGIPGPLSEAYELSITRSPRPVFVVIVARELDLLRAYKEQIVRLKDVDVQVYLTGPESDASLPPGIGAQRGRPDLESIIVDFALSTNALAVTCCGPPAFNDDARSSVARTIARFPNRRIEYFEEYQIW